MDVARLTSGRPIHTYSAGSRTALRFGQAATVQVACLLVGATGIALLNEYAASLALFGGYSPAFQTGMLTLFSATIRTFLLIGAAGLGALATSAIIVSLIFGRRTISRILYILASLMISVPLLAFVPLWFSLFGDGDFSASLFLYGCLTSYFLYVAAGASLTYAKLLRLMLTIYNPPPNVRRMLNVEFVRHVSLGQLREIGVLAVPFSVAAELISGTGGLGHIATLAYRNGNFGQLAVTACAYLILFGIVDAVVVLASKRPLD